MTYRCRRIIFIVVAAVMAAGVAGSAASNKPGAGYFVPENVPAALNRIDAKFDLGAGRIEGRETITLKNEASRPLDTISLDWNVNEAQSLEVSVGGTVLPPRRESPEKNLKGPLFFVLPSPVPSGGSLELNILFHQKIESSEAISEFQSSRWHPRLWWDGLPFHGDYSVRLDVPEGYALAASGQRDEKTGRFEARGINSFGVYLGKGMMTETRDAGGVSVTTVFSEKGRKAAAVCMETALDAIAFYRKWLGFYPYPFLSIIPGGAGRWGGYPFAPGVVAIHGLETYKEGESPQHWQHITSHEIGHEYWGEWVMDGDNPSWLWICMGVHADTEYMIARGYDPHRRVDWMGNYVRAVSMHYDTALDVTPAQEDRILYDRNNLVIHSKGPAFLNALEVVLGLDAFDRVYKKALRAYGGKRLGWKEFQRFCEAETAQSLGWFFDSWVRGNSYLCYAIESRDSQPVADGFKTEIRVRRLGTMAMPVPVQAVFEDGTSQTVMTDRTKILDTVVFESKARLKDAVLDPERRLAMLAKPIPEIPADTASAMAWGLDPARSLEVYEALRGIPGLSVDLWQRLGLNLYDADFLAESSDCFAKLAADADPDFRFLGPAWQGLIEDLRENRERALQYYKEALARDKGESFGFGGNFRLRIDRAWLEARLKTPYSRESAISLPERPTVEEMVSLVDGLGWTREGRNPHRIYEKAAGMDIPRAGFWFKLGMLLFDSGDDEESLTAFSKAAAAADASRFRQFSAWVWQGHLNDLLGRRDAALAAYRKALELDIGQAQTHSQYRMTIDRRWVEARIQSPFVWKKRK